jgi:hypothetical protein
LVFLNICLQLLHFESSLTIHEKFHSISVEFRAPAD